MDHAGQKEPTPFQRVYALLRERGGMSRAEISKELGYSPKTCPDIALMSLENAGYLVYQEKDGTVRAFEGG